MSTLNSTQLPLDLPSREATGREDFLVSCANQAAVSAVDAWPNWPHQVLVIVGPAGSGKSHLAAVWRKMAGATVVAACDLSVGRVPQLMEDRAVVVEDAPSQGLDETALFHLFNLARETGGSILLTTQQWPSRWPVGLPDLASRLKQAQVVTLSEPDDSLLRGVLVKLFGDRQLAVDEAVISFMLKRMERSFDAARRLVAEIDAQALAGKAEITRRFVSRVMQSFKSGGECGQDEA